jgi:DNA-binding NarL/FixJ family response regulator
VAEQSGQLVLVDEDPAFRKRFLAVLNRAGYEIVGVASAEEALGVIENQRPDVVLTDVGLPGLSGYELCRRLKDQYGESIAVVIISGERTEPFDRAAGIFLGADDYMTKPVDSGELVARIWRLLERSSANRLQTNGNARLDVLSGRERQVLDLLTGGFNQEGIAEALFISPKTVATHIQRILTKLGVRSRTQAVALALTQDVAAHVIAPVRPVEPTAPEVDAGVAAPMRA